MFPEGSSTRPPEDASPRSDRLLRVEEATTFNERAIESLTAQSLDLEARLRRLAARLEALETRLNVLCSPDEPDEPIS
ncbi:MAG: hypothetical protein AB7K52_09900 [Phycisphaerales bacterium]